MGIFTWIAIIALFFYLTPLVRLLGRPARSLLRSKSSDPFPLHPLLIKIGRWEYLFGLFRDRLLSVILFVLVVYHWLSESPLSRDTLVASSWIVFCNLLSIITIRYRDSVRLKLSELARIHSNIHPQDFFNLYYSLLSPWPPNFPRDGFRSVSYHEADYRTGEAPIQKITPLLESILSTNTLAYMAMMAFQRVGTEHGRDAFDGLARLWGSRVAQLFKMRLHTTYQEEIAPLEGKTLLVFNHQSTLDFGLNFFALGDILVFSKGRLGPGTRHLRPRFIAAKDHFIDNPIIYSWIGLGKVIENAGMIFINRKKKGMGWLAMQEAAEKLVASDAEVAVYPQGTRAYPLYTTGGEREDAGFYTTFGKKTWGRPLGHLKPGTAHLILDSLIELKKQGEKKLNILLTGIMGAGIAAPKGVWLVQTQAEIEYRVGPVWTLSTELAAGVNTPQGKTASTPEEQLYFEKIETIQQELSNRLVKIMDWHQLLQEKLTKELASLGFSPEDIEKLNTVLKQAIQDNEAKPFILLDRIFSLKPNQWKRFFQLWISVKDNDPKQEAWRAILQEVSEKLMSY